MRARPRSFSSGSVTRPRPWVRPGRVPTISTAASTTVTQPLPERPPARTVPPSAEEGVGAAVLGIFLLEPPVELGVVRVALFAAVARGVVARIEETAPVGRAVRR